MKKVIFGLLLTAATWSFAQDSVNTGNNWHALCSGQAGESGQIMCGTFISGLISGVNTQADYFKTEKIFCFPESAQYRQGRDVFANYLAAHPESRHLDMTTLAVISLVQAFPCPQVKKPKYTH